MVAWIDEHVHLMAAAAARVSVDVSVEVAPRLEDVFERLRTAPSAKEVVRAWGFDDALVLERRAPTRDELDAVVPDRPLTIHHRSGHEEYANSWAVDHRPPRLDLAEAMQDLVAELSAAGVHGVTDATATNGIAEIEQFRRWRLPLAITLMVGADRLSPRFPYGWTEAMLSIGHAKVAAPADAIGALVRSAHAQGWPAAVHVVEIDELEAALAAFEASPPPAGAYDRIEHLALSLPEHVERLAALGPRVAVVTQPAFLLHRGAKYRDQLSAVEQTWLYRVRSLTAKGVAVAFSSDLPVTPSRPWEWIAAATDRAGFNPDEIVDRATAEAMTHGLPSSLHRGG